MAAECLELKLNRLLINNNFDGYKLSLEPLPVYSYDVKDVAEVHLSEELYSFQQVKTFTLHNHLHQDPWNPNHFYYISTEWTVQKFIVDDEDLKLPEPKEVFKIPKNVVTDGSKYNVTVHFASEEYVVLADGLGNLYVIDTGNRLAKTAAWKVCFTTNLCAFSRPFILLHAVCRSFAVDCLLLYVVEKSAVEASNIQFESSSTFTTVLEWVTLAVDGNGDWKLSRTRRLTGGGSVDYAALEINPSAICVVSEKPFKFTYDSVKEVSTVETNDTMSKASASAYAWLQTLDDVTVWFKFSEKIRKEDVVFQLTSTYLSLSLRDRSVLLEGVLFANIDVEGSTWTMENNRLDVFLNKVNKGLLWQELVKGDNRGEEILDGGLVSDVQERLAHLTSDQEVNVPQNKFSSMNPQQLEECDAFPVDSYHLYRWDGDSHKVTHKVSLSSHQWLFSVRRKAAEVPAICIRHDVDGILWQPSTDVLTKAETNDDKFGLQHVATFNALGYVLASKQQKKFLSCSVDCTFSVMCDVQRHVYIYFQPSDLESELRNRKTGFRVQTTAVQKVISLDTTDILGLHVSDKNIFVLTREKVYLIKVLI